MGNRDDQCEERISKLDSGDALKDQSLRDNLQNQQNRKKKWTK